MRPVAWFGFLTNEQMFTSSINVQLSSKKMRGSLRVETIDVAILMGGGPAVIYGTQALAAVDELAG